MNLKKHIDYVIDAHTHRPKAAKNKFRYWDKKTPYYIHPLWCAMTLLTETSLPKKLRENGAVALLYHDLLEDTNAKLPKTLDKKITFYVQQLTFYGGFEEERKLLLNKGIEIKLLKLYDKVSNLLDGSWMNKKERKIYTDFTKKIMIEVEKYYGLLNIVKIAREIVK
jgi:(p)ppGpp synthase/HD superfamily hydrolase